MAKLDNCQRKDELISYLYEELAPEAVATFRTHLAQCPACQQAAAEFGQARNLLQAWDIPVMRPLALDFAAIDNLPTSANFPSVDNLATPLSDSPALPASSTLSSHTAVEENPCARKADLMGYLYNELDNAQHLSFKQHLPSCASCQRQVAEFPQLQQHLQAWEVPTNNRVDIDFAAQQPYTLRRILTDLANILPAWFKYSAGLATACSLLLITMAVLQTEVQWNQQGFRVQLGILGSKSAPANLNANNNANTSPANAGTTPMAAAVDEALVREMVAKAITEKQTQLVQDLEEKRAQIVTQLERQIALLSDEISEKSNSQLTRATLELRRKTREELERALLELQQNRGSDNLDDPFNFMGQLDWTPTTTSANEENSKSHNAAALRRLGKE